MFFPAPRLALATLVGTTLSCATEPSPPPPPPNLVVSVTPALTGSFAGLGGVHAYAATVKDTMGNPLSDPVTWTMAAPTLGVTVTPDGVVTVATSATQGDYGIRASAGGVTGTAIARVLPRPAGSLFFVSVVNGDGQVFVKDLSTFAPPMQITNGTGAIGGLAIDQVTRMVFFTRGVTPNHDLFTMNETGTGLVNLTNDVLSANQGPSINPVSHFVYFTRQVAGVGQVFKIFPNGTGLTQVSTGSQSKSVPAVSPDGQSLAWTEVFQPSSNLEVVIATVDGQNPVRFTDHAGLDAIPFWLSNTRLIWSSNTGITNFEIFAADVPGGGNLQNLTNAAGSDASPSSGCIPAHFTFLSSRGGPSEAYDYDLTNGLVVKYQLSNSPTILFARRMCAP
jgi:Tol biopolymer transport system component